MARLLFVVESAFTIQDRGLVLIPGIVPEGKELFRVGDRFRLKRPDGSVLDEKVDGIEFLSPPPPNYTRPLMFNRLTKTDVPIGTEVWSIDPS